jgi:hypothetical protein
VKAVKKGRLPRRSGVLLLLGEDRFGSPDGHTRAALEKIDDVRIIERMVVQHRNAGSWQQLLGQRLRRRRNGRGRS